MAKQTKWIIGILTLIATATLLSITFGDDLKIDITKTKSSFYVNESNDWKLAGTEYNVLYNGSKVLKSNKQTLNKTINGNKVILVRISDYPGEIKITDTYKFDGSLDDVKLFPISHEIKIENASGKKFVYRVKDLVQTVPDGKLSGGSQVFGRNMKVTWDSPYVSAVLKKGTLEITYIVDSDDFVLYNRLFDPPKDLLTDKAGNKIECKIEEKVLDHYDETIHVVFYNYTYYDENATGENTTFSRNYTETIYTPVYKVVCSDRNVASLELASGKKIVYKEDHTYSVKDGVFTVKDLSRGGSWEDRDINSCWNPGVPCVQTKLDTLTVLKESKDSDRKGVEKIE